MKLVSNLTRLGNQAPMAAEAALLRTAADIVEMAKQLVPVDTGALKQSIGAVPVSSSVVQVGAGKGYAKFVEYGTIHSAAQPFLTPAFAQNQETFLARLREELEKILK